MSKKKVIIYSRQPYLAAFIAETIGCSNSLPICCYSIEELIEACGREMPPVVIILEVTPFINGTHLIERIRPSHHRRPSVYVISWQQDERTVVGLLECGVTQYMTFPICVSRLQNKILAHDTPTLYFN